MNAGPVHFRRRRLFDKLCFQKRRCSADLSRTSSVEFALQQIKRPALNAGQFTHAFLRCMAVIPLGGIAAMWKTIALTGRI